MMKRALLILLGVTTCVMAHAQVSDCYSCYADATRICPCGWIATGELLYLRPATNNLQYAISDPRAYIAPDSTAQPPQSTEQSSPQGRFESILPDYQLGYRFNLGAIFAQNCADMIVTYSRVHRQDSARLIPSPATGGIWAIPVINADVVAATATPAVPPFDQIILFNPSGNTTTFPNELNAVASCYTRFNWDAADITFGWRSTLGCRLWIRGYSGIHYTYVHYLFNRTYQGTLHPGQATAPFASAVVKASLQEKGTSWGAGPLLGLEANYSVGCGFGIGGRAAAAVITGRQWVKHTDHFTEQDGQAPGTISAFRDGIVRSRDERLVAPMLHGRLGFTYTTINGNCFVFSGQLGYEMTLYPGLLLQGPQYRIDRGTNALNCAAFHLDGLYLNGVIEF